VSDENQLDIESLLRLPLQERIRAVTEIQASRELNRTSLREFYISQGYRPAAHHDFILNNLQQVAEGKIKRLMIFAPPGHAKSRLASVVFPAWYVGAYPGEPVICASHSATLAEYFSYLARAIVAGPEYSEIFDASIPSDARSVSYWRTTENSEYFAIGVGGGVTGRRAMGLIIDDPVSGAEAANSETQRNSLWNWYITEARTRLKGKAAWVVIIQTRWHLDDLSGRILPEDWNGEHGWVTARDGEEWFVVRLPVEAEENDQLGRAVGEPLWPEWYGPEQIEIQKAALGPQHFAALYQQRPIPQHSSELNSTKLQRYRDMPAMQWAKMARVIVADPAGSRKKTSDRTVMWVVGLGMDGNYYLLDGICDRIGLTDKWVKLQKLHRDWSPVRTGYERYGMQSDMEHFRDTMERTGYRFIITELKGPTAKNDRIRRLDPFLREGRLWVPQNLHYTMADGRRIDLIDELVKEMDAFPYGRHDDLLDALSRICDEDMQFRASRNIRTRKLDTPLPQMQPNGDGLWF
jgi:hypothetical protein